MSKRRDPNPEFDLFIPALGDLPLKDQREVMERPFFSLQKRKRLKPIEYRSPDGDAWVRVQAIPDYGMATIWDADILIWAASTLNRMKQQGLNDLPRTLTTTPYDLLRAIKRSTGGRDYQELQAARLRLQTTSITTSIRATKRRQKAGFNWLDSWTFDTDAETEQPRGMTLTTRIGSMRASSTRSRCSPCTPTISCSPEGWSGRSIASPASTPARSAVGGCAG